jgi:hypothetical protein
VGDLSQLLTALTALIGAITGFTGLVWGIVRTLRKEPRQAAKTGAQKYADELVAAAEDGDLTAEEIERARRHLDEPRGENQ